MLVPLFGASSLVRGLFAGLDFVILIVEFVVRGSGSVRGHLVDPIPGMLIPRVLQASAKLVLARLLLIL